MVSNSTSHRPAVATGERRVSRRLFSKRVATMIAGAAALGSPVAGLASEGTSWQVSGESAPQETAPAAASGGQAVANFALAFYGYPYVWAGNTPAGFDCSGFTQYVVVNTLGIDIGHGTAGQMNYGAFVDYGAWVPGDLVYFAGTYGPGITHTGVYIGDGQFIHAENEGTGVTISSIFSNYYSSHYYGAIRLA